MALTRVLLLVLAGGAGSRLEKLTENRAKPAVRFAGTFRLVDVPLSNAQHSHVSDVWVVEQFHPASLVDHLANGRPWDLDRSSGGLLVLHPHLGSGRAGWHSGTADAVWRQAPLVRDFAPDVLVVVSADSVYRLDYREVADAHLASEAAVTMVTTEVPRAEAARYGVVTVGDDGVVTGYAYKPDEPSSTTVTTEVFAFDPDTLLTTLERLAEQAGEDGLDDLGNHGLPQLVEQGRARAVPLRGYWRDVGTVDAYWQAHMHLLADDPPLDLHDRTWPFNTQGARNDGAVLGAGAAVTRSLVSPVPHPRGSVGIGDVTGRRRPPRCRRPRQRPAGRRRGPLRGRRRAGRDRLRGRAGAGDRRRRSRRGDGRRSRRRRGRGRGRQRRSHPMTTDQPATRQAPVHARGPSGATSSPPRPSEPRDAVLGAAFTRTANWSLRLLLIAAASVVLGVVLNRLWIVVLPVLLALLLSAILWPAVSLLRRRLPPALAASLVLLAALLFVVGLVLWLAPQVTSQAQELADAVSAGLGDLRGLVTGPPLNLGRDQLGDLVDQAIVEMQGNAQTIAGWGLTGVSSAASILVNALLAIVLSFFFLKDGTEFLPWISRLVGPRAAPHTVEIARRSWTTLSGFIKAQAAVGLVDAVAIGIGLAVLGIPLALPLAVLIFFGAFIPIIGATVTGALAALVALVTNGLTSALIVVALVLVVQQVEGNVLQPILMSRTLDLHPALVILAVTAGGSLAGVVGAFLAVPVTAVGAVTVRYARQRLDGPDALEPVDPPPAPEGVAGTGDD